MGIVGGTASGDAAAAEIRRWQLLHRSSTSSSSSPPPLPGGASAAESGSGASDDHRPLQQQQQHWSSFDSSVNAVSFGFVATAILISMFLVMAIFERFLRPNSPSPNPPSSSAAPSSSRRARRQGPDVESGPQLGFNQPPGPGFNPKLGYPSPKMTVYTKGVSVLMPGEEFPTFIAHPAPVPCPPERISWPIHQQNQYWNPAPLNASGISSNRHHGS